PRTGMAIERVEKTLYEELYKVQTTVIEEHELQKAKNIAAADFYRSMKTINGKANVLGTYDVVFGDYHKLFTAVDLINQVTPEEVQRVARKYFGARNRTVGILFPESEPQKE